MIQRIKRKEVKFEEGQFYLIQVKEDGFFQFIDKDTLNVIFCTGFERVEICMENIFRKYKSYDILNKRLKKMEFYTMSPDEKEKRRAECKVKGERYAHLIDEAISNYYKTLTKKEVTKRSLSSRFSVPDNTARPEEHKRPEQKTRTAPEETPKLQRAIRPKKRPRTL